MSHRVTIREMQVAPDRWVVDADFAHQLADELSDAKERIERLEDIIKRAANRFFADGSDGTTASDMLTILDEAREAKP